MGVEDDYVGYGHPPKATRFQKGVSGNPRGRPRKAKPSSEAEIQSLTNAAILKVGHQSIAAKVDGKAVKMSLIEAIVQKQATTAIAGNPIAQRDFTAAHRKAEEELAARSAVEERERRQQFERIVEWRLLLVRKWATASRRNEEPADPWPHPDDVLVDRANLTLTIRGPISEDGVGFYRLLEAQRDLHILDEVLTWYERSPAARRHARALFYRVIWNIHDQSLPKRWQVDRTKIELWIDWLILQPAKRVRALRQECQERVRALQCHDRPATKQSQAIVNRIMKPILQKAGYRSLAQLEQRSRLE